ncbi:MAG: Stk1 family PASTA domain-containing Ser/Thr kinase [Nostocoides sp.]
MSPTPRLLDGRYEVGDLIGRGGMAEVHLGHDNRLGRQVAIKMLRADLARDQTFIKRFRREAQSAAGLNHSSIVAVYDHGEEHHTEPGGGVVEVPYIVMEYVDGRTLREVLTDRGHLPAAEAARITEGVLDALAYSHRHGIVHRDIKPANVMIARDGAVKVMDFGIARAVADTAATMTQTQAVLGTAQYLSPEQAQGHQVDARSDLYSTGCLLFELLTGRPPFTGDSPVSIAYQHVGEAAARPSTIEPEVPAAMDDIVAHALVKNREGRYQSADAFRTDLTAFRLGRPISPEATGAAAAAGVAGAALGASSGAPTQRLSPTDQPTQVYSSQTIPGGYAYEAGNTAAYSTGALPEMGTPEPEPSRRRTGAYVLLTLAVLAVFALVGWGILSALNGTPTEPTTVVVPDVVKKDKTNAENLLTARGLKYQENFVPSQEAKDTVVTQSEPAGSSVPKNTIINLGISNGPNAVQVPDVSSLTVEEATTTLERAKLTVAAKQQSKDDSRFSKGRVDSTNPGVGVTVAEGDSITLIVSTGKVTVPNVVGKTSDQAAAQLSDAGLSLGVQRPQESDQKAGTIVQQDPAGGLLDRNAPVNVWIAIPIQTPTPNPTTTPTPTPTLTGGAPTPPTTP